MSTNKCSGRAIKALKSIKYDQAKNMVADFDPSEAPLYDSTGEPYNFISQDGIGAQNTVPESMGVSENFRNIGDPFDWFQLPLNEQLIFDDVFEDSLWEEACPRHPHIEGVRPYREDELVVPWCPEGMIGENALR